MVYTIHMRLEPRTLAKEIPGATQGTITLAEKKVT
jgi:hypothetical protein